MLPYSLVAGHQKILTVTLKSAAIKNFKPFASLRQGGDVFLDFFRR